MRYHYIPIEQLKFKILTIPNATEVREKQKLSFIAGGNTKWLQPLWKTV